MSEWMLDVDGGAHWAPLADGHAVCGAVVDGPADDSAARCVECVESEGAGRPDWATVARWAEADVSGRCEDDAPLHERLSR